MERARLRGERAEERNAAKDEMTLQQQLLEQEHKVLELKLRLQESGGNSQAAEATAQASSSAPVTTTICSRHRLIPPFNDATDDLDAYIQHFERVATCKNGYETNGRSH